MLNVLLRLERSESNELEANYELKVGPASPVKGAVASPQTIVIEGEQQPFDRCFAWYLEGYLKIPFDLDVDRAKRIVAARDQWGRQAFDAIFGSPQSVGLYALVQQHKAKDIHLTIESEDPTVLSWPWEALLAPNNDHPGLSWTVSRTISIDKNAGKTWGDLHLETPQLEVLLVTARPAKDRDVGYRSISRPLVELAKSANAPVKVQLLRPRTFEALQEHLDANPDRYHVLHFDGHGTYGSKQPPSTAGGSPVSRYYLGLAEPSQGFLQFEAESAEAESQGTLVTAERMSMLLDEHRIPIVVLNACRSAMVDDRAVDEFASVAASLSKAGVRSVVAMSHNLWVSGAQEFIPTFYRALLNTGTVSEAVRTGRNRMRDHAGRICSRGRWDLEDWTVPMLFEQHPAKIVLQGTPPTDKNAPDAQAAIGSLGDTPYGFIGRDRQFLALEDAIRRPTAPLIHGIGGIGKSTLVAGFLDWLATTGGLNAHPIAFRFDQVTVDYILNRIGDAFGLNTIATLPLHAQNEEGQTVYPKVDLLAQAFRQLPFQILCILDNLEVLTDAGAGEAKGRFTDEDREAVRRLIHAAHGTNFKILITSRSDETWLGEDRIARIDLPGFGAEERWEFVNAVATSKGLPLDRNDKAMVDLIDAINGHPLLMTVVLPRLGSKMTAAQALDDIKAGLPATLSQRGARHDTTLEKLRSVLTFATEGLPEDVRPLLTLIGLHERFVTSQELMVMAGQVDASYDEQAIGRCVESMSRGGLVGLIEGATSQGVLLEFHPALAGHLRSSWLSNLTDDDRAPWERAFIDVLARMADRIAPMKGFEQAPYHHVHGSNFRNALALASRLTMATAEAALLQSLAAYAQNTRRFDDAHRDFERLAELQIERDDSGGVAGAYHQLGSIAQERRAFDDAEKWYKKSLEIKERSGNEHHAASTYHQLGIIAEERRAFDDAEKWYKKSLEIKERSGNEHHAASTYHQLGIIAEERRAFDDAEKWYKKSLEIDERSGNEHGAASTYHQLGSIAQERRAFDDAEKWYKKSLEINERSGNEHHAASTYHQLGRIAQERRAFDDAERWYKKSLEINERSGNEHHAASTYHQLGRIAQERRAFDDAEKWYKRSLEIKERSGNEHGAAITYHQLGSIAQERRAFDEAEKWYNKSLEIKERSGNEHGAASTYHQLGSIAQERRAFDDAERWYKKSLEIEERSGNEHGAASTYGQLGLLAIACGNFADGVRWLVRAMHRFGNAQDPHSVSKAFIIVARLIAQAPEAERPALQRVATDGGLAKDDLDQLVNALLAEAEESKDDGTGTAQ